MKGGKYSNPWQKNMCVIYKLNDLAAVVLQLQDTLKQKFFKDLKSG